MEKGTNDGLDRTDSRAAARICGVVRPLFPDGDRMRKTIVKGLYLLLTEMIAVYLVAFPVHAFQVSSSSTGYVRVATASAVSAYQVAQRAAFTSALASAVSAPTVASVAVRIATGPVGWGLLGVSVAVTLAGMYYSGDVQAVKTAAIATLPTTIAIPGYTAPAGSGFVGVYSPREQLYATAVCACRKCDMHREHQRGPFRGAGRLDFDSTALRMDGMAGIRTLCLIISFSSPMEDRTGLSWDRMLLQRSLSTGCGGHLYQQPRSLRRPRRSNRIPVRSARGRRLLRRTMSRRCPSPRRKWYPR